MNDDARGPVPPPPSSSLEALLKHERLLPSQPDVVRARALMRARTSPHETPAPPLAGRPMLATGASRLIVAAAAGLVIAGGAAVALKMRRQPPPPAIAAPPVPAAPETSPAPALPDPAPTATAEADVRPTPVHALHSSRRLSAASKHDGVTDEVQLLGRARACDARGDYAGVLALVAQHERAHAAGRLTEEREVLRVKALVGLGRADEARAAAARFRRDFPRSVLLPRVEEMQANLP